MKKNSTHFSRVLFRMVLSFFGIICFTTLLIGSICVWVFNQSYRMEIEKIYALSYQNVYRSIEADVLNKVTDLYLNICTKVGIDLQQYEHAPIDQSYSKLYSLQQYLQEYAAVYSDMISEISVYSENDGLLVSSFSGLIYFQNNPSAAAYKDVFLEEYRKKSGGIRWISSQINPYNTDSFLTMSAPVISSGLRRETNIVINIAVSRKFMENLLTNSSSDSIHFALRRRDSQMIPYINETDQDFLLALEAPAIESEVSYYSGTNDIILYQEFPNTGCILYSVADAETFYQKAQFLQLVILLVCGAAILLSSLLSGIIARRLYRPVRRIIASSAEYSRQFSLTLPNSRDEYGYLDVLLNSLTFRLSHLQQTLSSNQQLIQYSLFMKLLSDSGIREDFIQERLELLSLRFDRSYYYVFLAQFPAFSQQLPAEKYEFLYYQAIHLIQQSNSDDRCSVALKMTDETIAVIVNTEERDLEKMKQWLEQLHEQLRESLVMDVRFLISKSSDQLAGIYQQYHNLRALQQEFFVMPNCKVLTEDYLNSRLLSDQDFYEPFAKALQQRNLGEIKQVLSQILEFCYAGQISYIQLNRLLLDILNLVAQFVKTLNIRLNQDLYDEFSRCDHIESFTSWMYAVIDESFRIISSKSTVKTSGVVADVVDYVIRHIDAEYNLNTLAEQFHLSPNYLSKIFKEQTGQSILDFINQCRLEQAAFYLEHTDLNIDTIAQKVGFSHTTYFIKKFREKYGVTPKNYRLIHQEPFHSDTSV